MQQLEREPASKEFYADRRQSKDAIIKKRGGYDSKYKNSRTKIGISHFRDGVSKSPEKVNTNNFQTERILDHAIMTEATPQKQAAICFKEYIYEPFNASAANQHLPNQQLATQVDANSESRLSKQMPGKPNWSK